MWILLRIAALVVALAGAVVFVVVLIQFSSWNLGISRKADRTIEWWAAVLVASPVFIFALGLEGAARWLRDKPRTDALRAAGFAVTEADHGSLCVQALQRTGFVESGSRPLFCGMRGRGWATQVAAQFEDGGGRYCVVAVRCDESWPRVFTRRIDRLDKEWFKRLAAEDPAWAPAWFRRRVAIDPCEAGPCPGFVNDATMTFISRGSRKERWGIGGGWLAVCRPGALSVATVEKLADRCSDFSRFANGLQAPRRGSGSSP